MHCQIVVVVKFKESRQAGKVNPRHSLNTSPRIALVKLWESISLTSCLTPHKPSSLLTTSTKSRAIHVMVHRQLARHHQTSSEHPIQTRSGISKRDCQQLFALSRRTVNSSAARQAQSTQPISRHAELTTHYERRLSPRCRQRQHA